MSWSIDHIAVTAQDWQRSVAFYEATFGMVQTKLKLVDHPDLVNHPEVREILGPERFAHMLDPFGSSLHIIKSIPNFYARYPQLKKDFTASHVALTVGDLGVVKQRLEDSGTAYEVPREWGPTGFERLYVDDPFMNVIEPNMRVGVPAEASGDAPPPPPPPGGWRIDHIHLISFDLPRSVAWFRDLLGLAPGDPDELPAEAVELYGATPETFAVFPNADGRAAVHISVPDPEASARNAWWLNPMMRGHAALTVDDLDAVIERLEALGVRYQDAGTVGPRRVLYTYDPSMNVLECNQQI